MEEKIKMITHIVCWKYKPGTSREQKAEHLAKLQALPKLIPDIKSYSAGSDVLQLDRSFDTGLVAVYSDIAALEAYSAHPEHQKVVALGKEIAEKVISVDFETVEGSGSEL